jgi:hypothetical protein
MSTTMLRWLLSPRTSWRAWCRARASRGSVSFDVAWRHARIRGHPDETPYQRRGHRPADSEHGDPPAAREPPRPGPTGPGRVDDAAR